MNDPIRTVVVDDEAMSRAALRVRVTTDSELELIAECSDGLSALQTIRTMRPELLLLDIQMPRLTGLQLIENLDPEACPVVVFVTAHDEYAVRAFDLAAVDYLLKPFDADRFALAMRRAKDRAYQIRGERADIGMELAAPIMESGGAPGAYADRFLVRERERIFFLPVKDVDWIESSSNYVKLHTQSRIHLIRMKISELEQMLDPFMFARIHRCAIVRIDAIASMIPSTNGDHLVTLADGTELRLSRTYRDRVFAVGVVNG